MPPKLRGFAALLLALLIAFPFSAYASGATEASNINYQFYAVNGYSNIYDVANDTDCTSKISAKDLYTCSVTVTFPKRNYNKGDVVSFDVQDLKPVWINKVNFNVYMSVIIDNSETVFKRAHGLLADNQKVNTTYTFDRDCSASFKLQFDYSVFVIENTYENDYSWFGINASLNAKSETNGMLDKIIDFVKGIFENLKELPSKIGDFFSNLSTSLKQWFSDVGDWFSNLGDNLKQWFANVGDWFSSLGEKIGGFFTDIFDKIKDFFTNLFKPHDGYFEEVKNDLDKFLTEHLGIAYTLIPSLLSQTKEIITAVFNNGDDVIITFPALKIPVGDKTYVVNEAQSINFTDIYYHDKLNTVWLTLFTISDTVFSIGSALLFVRVVYKKFINKVGVEGGDEI